MCQHISVVTLKPFPISVKLVEIMLNNAVKIQLRGNKLLC